MEGVRNKKTRSEKVSGVVCGKEKFVAKLIENPKV